MADAPAQQGTDTPPRDASALDRRVAPRLLDEHADVADQAGGVAFEHDAFGIRGRRAVDLERLAELHERQPV